MSYAIRLLAVVSCSLLALAAAPAEARRVALVIGNSTYRIGPLANPGNDAAAVARVLEKDLRLDKVILKQNLGASDFRSVLSDFSGEAAGAELALVYFAGHGLEVSGVNFLIPVDAQPRRAADLDLQAIPLQTVLNQLDGVKGLKLIILDACRDNPFSLPGAKRTVQRGLKAFEPEESVLVVYAARDGTTADDGVGRAHSPFTEGLLKHLATPNVEVRLLFGRVRDEVMEATGKRQVPHYYVSLGGKEVYLRKEGVTAPAPTPPAPPPAPERKLSAIEALPPPPPPVLPKDVARKDKTAPPASPPTPTPPPVATPPSQSPQPGQLGLKVVPVEGVNAKGVAVTDVNREWPAAAKIRVGDVILEVDNQAVNSAEELVAVIREGNRAGRRSAVLLVKSGNETHLVPVPLRRN